MSAKRGGEWCTYLLLVRVMVMMCAIKKLMLYRIRVPSTRLW
jgi:hypothetical protein